MERNIAVHLRDRLFDKPSPPQNNGNFEEIADEMFPRRAVFIAFLGERHFDEQVRLAKDILLRLAYKARVFPPTKLLFNLLEVESRLAGTAARAVFNGRDHFVHLVNLYLLGLYVFWYHDSLHKKVVAQFQEISSNPADRSKRDRLETAERAFVSAWRKFVLFHDLGYPWEVSGGDPEQAKFLKPFAQSLRYAAKDGALFALSQVLALESLSSDEGLTLFEDDLGPYLSKGRETGAELFPEPRLDFLNKWKHAVRLPFVSDAHLSSLITLIVPEHDRLAVLELRTLGHPVASSNSDLQSQLPAKHRKTIEKDLIGGAVGGRRLQEACGSEGNDPYQWVYYVRKLDDHLKAFNAALFGEAGAHKSFQSFAQRASRWLNDAVPGESEHNFEDYSFGVYQRLLQLLEFDVLEDAPRGDFAIYHSFVSQELRGQKGLLLTEIASALRELIQQRADELEKLDQPVNPTTLPLGDYLAQLLKVLSNKGKLAKQVEAALSEKIKARVKLKQDLFSFYGILKGELNKHVKLAGKVVFPNGGIDKGADASEVLWSASVLEEIAPHLSQLFQERGLDNAQVLAGYRSDFAKTSVSYIDHGIASGLLLAQLHNGWTTILGSADTALIRLIRLRGARDTVVHRKGENQTTHLEALYTIFIHNLYPRFFKNPAHQKFRTKATKREGFSYLALLCDSLQPWDRKRLFNQATGVPPYTTYAENFNIEVLGEILRISERGDRLRIDEREAGLRRYLNDYLEGASHMVKLRLGEWIE